jgi:amidase
MDELAYRTATELAAGIRRREVTAVEVVEAQIARIELHHARLNAIVTLDTDGARKRAWEADLALAGGRPWGPLHGVPVSIKDSLSTGGVRTTGGAPSLADYVPPGDATAVARLKMAGAIVLGKSNLPTFGRDSQTVNPVFGRTNNPWDHGRTPGGSSGGGAAAVAAGLVPLDIGSDWGGSLRVPAHYCGVFTIKPTDHLVPWTGHVPPVPGMLWGLRHLAAIGPLARSVGDLTLALGLMSGPDGHDWEVPPVPWPLAAEPPRGGRRRIAWADDFGVPVTADTRAAIRRLAVSLASQGFAVENRLPDGFDITQAWEVWGELRQMEMGASLTLEEERADASLAGASLESEVPWLRSRAGAINGTVRRHAAVMMARDGLIGALERFLGSYDAFLCPVTSGPAFPHCPSGTPLAVDADVLPYATATGSYCLPFNATGHPVVVLPVTRSSEGLPIGVQLIGRRWGDAALLALAAKLEGVIGPFQRPPGY